MARHRATLLACLLVLTLAPLTSACGDDATWEGVGEALGRAVAEELVEEAAEEAAPELSQATEEALSGLVLAGVTPADDYRQSGRVDLSLLSGKGAADLAAAGMRVQVEDADGSYRDCDYQDAKRRPAAAQNVVTLLLDGSGSMDYDYPPDEYEDTCLTCPHDPSGARLGAAHSFIATIFAEAPSTRLAFGEFGPEPTPGLQATLLHQDFATNADAAFAALDHAGDYGRVGTPLYDAIGEMVVAMDDEAYFVEEETGAEVRQIMVVLSDGRDTLSERYDLRAAIAEARAAGVVVYAMGLGPASALFDAGHDFDEQTDAVLDLQRLAAETGGFYAPADDPRALHDLFDAVAAALTGGYAEAGYHCAPTGAAPARGQVVRGRVSLADTKLPWAFVAP